MSNSVFEIKADIERVGKVVTDLLNRLDSYRAELIDCKKRLADVQEEKRLLQIRHDTILIDLKNAYALQSRLERENAELLANAIEVN